MCVGVRERERETVSKREKVCECVRVSVGGRVPALPDFVRQFREPEVGEVHCPVQFL